MLMIFSKVTNKNQEEEWTKLALESGFTYEHLSLENIERSFANIGKPIDWFAGVPYAVYDANQKIIATALIMKTIFDPRCTLSAWDIAVQEDLRAQGIGRFLMENLYRDIASNDITHLTLYTSSNNDGFYKACGMTEYGRLPNILENNTIDRVYLYRNLMKNGS